MFVGYCWTVGRALSMCVVAGVAGLAGPGRAQAGARPITFAEARAAGEAAAPDVALAAGRDQIARAQVGVAGALANPTVGATTARETAKLGVSLSVPLPLFGQRGTAVTAARGDADAAALDVEAARADGRFAASIAWLDLWEAQERARLLAEAASDAERVATIADEKFKAGTAPSSPPRSGWRARPPRPPARVRSGRGRRRAPRPAPPPRRLRGPRRT